MNRFYFLSFYLLLFIFSCHFSNQMISIHLKISDPSGEPISFGHYKVIPGLLTVENLSPEDLKSPDGIYKHGNLRIEIPIYTSFTVLVFAPNHEFVAVPFVLKDGINRINTEVYLPPLPISLNPSELKVLTSYDNYDEEKAIIAKKISETEYVAKIKAQADTLGYQVDGLIPNRTINGPFAARFVYDNGGDYISVIRGLRKGQILELPLVLSDYPSFQREGIPVVYPPHLAYLDTVYEGLDALNRLQNFIILHKVQEKPINELPDSLVIPVQKLYDFFISTKDSHIKSSLAPKFYALSFYASDKLKFNQHEIDKHLNPLSPDWYTLEYLFSKWIHETYPDSADSIINIIIHKNPNHNIGKMVCIASMMRYQYTDKEKMNVYYNLLKNNYEMDETTRAILQRLKPDSIITLGSVAPDFQIKLRDNSEFRLSDFRGKFVLIDFWATWCAPCREELPHLKKAYERFKSKNVIFISLSCDTDTEQLQKFLTEQFNIPWYNAILPGGMNNEICLKYKVTGIPTPFLIGPDGKILAIGADLTGNRLEKTLEKMINDYRQQDL